MSKFILHSNYTNGIDKVQLNDVTGDSCFVSLGGNIIHMALDNFLSRFKLCV